MHWQDYLWFKWGEVLANKHDVHDPVDAAFLERDLSARRELELRQDPNLIARSVDADQMRAVHHHLFQDMYEWAGQFREFPMGKAGTDFAPPHLLEDYVNRGCDQARGVDWANTTRDSYARGLADAYAWINTAHPFREGNGRSSRLLLAQLSEAAPWRLAQPLGGAAVEPWQWNEASAASVGPVPDPQPLIPVLTALTRPAATKDPQAAHANQISNLSVTPSTYAALFDHINSQSPGSSTGSHPRPRQSQAPSHSSER